MADTVAFGTMEWLDTYVKLFNEHPDMSEALKEFTARVAYEFTDRPDLVPKFVVMEEGVIKDYGELTDDSAVDYMIRADYEIWKIMTEGELDPMNALMAGKLKVRGNMAALLKHAEGFKSTFDIVQAIPTVFD
ncbi:MAG: SCP2 sterol-binding domain-containing protein [Actinobacteria bacterium]|nr:SCP2 sterol-binding domain-containing protein [Actinomycetota bacterium]MCG2820189.1 SCP2 sterol-binding domain-containing protein [Actinomycetes bacterium]MBU4179547.1 SCP2 sterol-binding domain-containing protein [Actinomycetota bacterium]MBU4219839.1 SCP2 sterol-binding domain-containing protein [Actinomycetota bacterium]MBU4357733.1 SCP2 sterol-binding domain-containing protein [Actinomycetota bacterium]